MEETRDNNEIYDILVNNILSTYDGDNGKSIVISWNLGLANNFYTTFAYYLIKTL